MNKLLVLALLAASAVVCALAQTPAPGPCRKVCSSLSGKCNGGLAALANTACFDKKINAVRTCDCNINTLAQLEALGQNDILSDCVIPRRLFGLGGNSVEIKAKLKNVHMTGISNVGTLTQSGDVTKSTICEWKCVGRNRFQNCRMTGNVKRSTFRAMDAGDEATLVISGDTFIRNKIQFITSDKGISIGCKEGFSRNEVEILATGRGGRFSSVLGTKFSDNKVDTISLGAVSSFADTDGNTARLASVEGPCAVLRVVSKTAVSDRLILPPGDRECAELFEQV